MSNILAATIEVQQEEIAELREQMAAAQSAIDERDTELAMLREALDTIPLHEYGEAQREGCDAKGAWDCFKEALAEHISAVRSVSAVYDAKNDITTLHQQLATVAALVASAELLNLAETALTERAAYLENCEDDEHEIRVYRAYANDVRALAARIRAWRGDGDGREGEGEGESDG